MNLLNLKLIINDNLATNDDEVVSQEKLRSENGEFY